MMSPLEWVYGPAVLYGAIVLLGVATLITWHTNPRYKDFTLVDLIAENGRVSSRKFMEFGAWIVTSAAIIVTVVRGTLTTDLLFIYIGSFVTARSVGQWMALKNDTEIRKAEIRAPRAPSAPKLVDPSPRASEDLTVEEEASRREEEVARLRASSTR